MPKKESSSKGKGKGKSKGKGQGSGDSLGHAIQKAQQRERRRGHEDVEALRKEAFSEFNVDDGEGFTSVTEQTSLEEFLSTAMLANRSFTTERNTHVVVTDEEGKEQVQSLSAERGAFDGPDEGEAADEGEGPEDEEEGKEKRPANELSTPSKPSKPSMPISFCKGKALPIPRRPAWTYGVTSKEELDRAEKDAFLEWRRGIAKMEEAEANRSLHVTPFEKNLQFWRQLWRVVERSDLLVQVLDARNPLLFRCIDLEEWVESLQKTNFLLLNKADFLTQGQREAWAAYFDKEGIKFAFFSATQEQAKLDSNVHDEQEIKAASTSRQQSSTAILTRTELLQRFKEELKQLSPDPRNEKEQNKSSSSSSPSPSISLTLGTVGYPNVGKSSVINVLCEVRANAHDQKRVSVAATPGHTKHFQTLTLSSAGLILCDCPGLVFPSLMASKAEMICFGILPVDEIRGRDWVPAVDYLCQRIPRDTLESHYGISLQPTSMEHINANTTSALDLVPAVSAAKGYYASGGGGRFDEGKCAKRILKEAMRGDLVLCILPPGYREIISPNDRSQFAGTSSSKSGGSQLSHSKQDQQSEVTQVDEAAMDRQHEQMLIDMLRNQTSLGDPSLWGSEDENDEEKREERKGAFEGDHLTEMTGNDNISRKKSDSTPVRNQGPEVSRRKARHGRKHRAARSRNPYEDGTAMNNGALMTSGMARKQKPGYNSRVSSASLSSSTTKNVKSVPDNNHASFAR